MDRTASAPPPLYVRRCVPAHRDPGLVGDRHHADRHISGHRYPRRQRDLDLHRPLARRDGKAHGDHHRARHDHHGQRHRAHGVAVATTAWRSSRCSSSPPPSVELALAQVTAIVQTILRVLPPGTTPPFIVQYNASSVPMLQLGLSGEGLSEQQLYDYGTNFIRTQLGHRAGSVHPAALRRQAAADHGRHRSRPAVRQGPLRHRTCPTRSTRRT